MNEYQLPDVGEGLTEAEIVTWRVRVGDVVKVNDVVVEIETAKSVVELPSPYAGSIEALLVPEGETVLVGTPLIRIGEGTTAPAPAEPAREVEVEVEVAESAPAVDIDMSNPAATGGENQTLVGYGPREASAKRRPRRGGATPATDAGAAAQARVQGSFTPGGATTTEADPAAETVEEAAAEDPVPSVSAPPAGARPPGAGEVRVLAKPPVRKLARDLGVDLRTLTPSGPHGTVSRADVEQAASGARTAAGGRSQQRGGRGERREPVRGVRKLMAQAMVDSAFSAPHVTEWVTLDVTRTMRLVARLRSHRDLRDVRVSPLLILARAATLAMRRTPEINASWDEEAGEVVYKDYVNLGIAAATPRGLVVPNVKDADALPLVDLARALDTLTRVAREGRTQPGEMSGGTFTITNVGVFGVDAGTPIINPGEAAILCFGAVRPRPWVHKGKVRAREVTTLALSFDHRLVDGEGGSRFLADVAAILEDPAIALLH